MNWKIPQWATCSLLALAAVFYLSNGARTIESSLQAQDKTASPLLLELKAILENQSNAWNAGKLENFMSAYWKDDRLSFSSGGKTTRGWQATLDHYRQGYPDRATMGKLTFTELEAEALGPESALMLGRWKLEREKPAEGNFSLIWRKINNQWLIIHDHSSESE